MRRWFIFTALIVAGSVTALVGLEAVLRLPAVFNPGIEAEFVEAAKRRDLDWVAHPFLPYVGNPGRRFDIHWTDPEGRTTYIVDVQLNSRGFRTHEFPDRKMDDDLVVVCLGGSTVWGAVAPTNAETWPELLEAKLQEAHPTRNVRVYNLGMSGGSTAVSVVNLAIIGVPLQPDLVIAYGGINDTGPVAMHDYKTDQSHYFVDFVPESNWLGFHYELPGWLRSSRVAVYAATWLDSIGGANSLMERVTRESDPNDHAPPEVAIERTFANLLTIHSIADGHGARALFSTFQFFDPSVLPYPLNDGLRRAFAANGMDYVDIDARIPDGDRSLQVDECHFTDAGREIVADSFFRHIMEHRLLASEDGG